MSIQDIQNLPAPLRNNPATLSMVARLDRLRNTNSALKAAAGDSASVRAGAMVAAGGALVGAAERYMPSLRGARMMGAPLPLAVGLVGILMGAGAGSTVAVELAGGMAACGARDLIAGAAAAPSGASE